MNFMIRCKRLPFMRPGSAVGTNRTRDAAARLRRDPSAAALLEFAIVAPVFVGLLMGGIGVIRLMYIDMLMHDAVVEAARFGVTGAATQSGSRTGSMQTIMSNITGLYTRVYSTAPTSSTFAFAIARGYLVLTAKPYQDWPSLANGSVASTKYGTEGDENNVVVYSASYKDPLVNRLLAMVSAPAITLTEGTIVQNEQCFNQAQGSQ